jgi:hypothetical protein
MAVYWVDRRKEYTGKDDHGDGTAERPFDDYDLAIAACSSPREDFWLSPVELGDIKLELSDTPSVEGLKAKLHGINSGVGPI